MKNSLVCSFHRQLKCDEKWVNLNVWVNQLLCLDGSYKLVLWHWYNFQVNRPISMKKDGIQTRKRKPKNPAVGGGSMSSSSMMKPEKPGWCMFKWLYRRDESTLNANFAIVIRINSLLHVLKFLTLKCLRINIYTYPEFIKQQVKNFILFFLGNAWWLTHHYDCDRLD